MFEKIKLWFNLISCTFTHPRIFAKIEVKDLVFGDLLFFHGHTLLNKCIQSCTNSKYNHVAVYIGDGQIIGLKEAKKRLEDYLLFHAIGKGLMFQSFKEAWEDSDKFIDVYRYHADTKITLRPEVQNRLAETINKYANDKIPYAVSALITLGLLTQLRRTSSFAGRRLLDDAFEELISLIENGKPYVDCSEIGYRIFDESGFPIVIIPEGLHWVYVNSNDPMIQKLKSMKKNKYGINPNFVTPHDLVISPDIQFVGHLKKP